MTETAQLAAIATPPGTEEVLRRQGVPAGAPVSDRVREIVDASRETYARLADPRGIWTAVTTPEFGRIYVGEGRNAARSPLQAIAPRAERLFLFAATVGERVVHEISRLFEANEPALAYALDTIGSERADSAADEIGRAVLDRLVLDGHVDPASRALPYSPGYCGWHVTGQRRLFAALEPDRIGIRLNASCLMTPLKSVSGVIVVGPGPSHRFVNDYEFCDACETRECRERIRSIGGDEPLGANGGSVVWTS